MTIHVINTGFILDINVTYNMRETRSDNEFHYTHKETCIASQGIPCRQNQRCPIDEKNFLCNESLTYCVKSNYKCDGQNNCNSALTLDKTDEKNCTFPAFKYTILSIVTIFLIVINLFIKMKHNNTLKQNNMKRYDQDIYKRKDLLRLRKNKENVTPY